MPLDAKSRSVTNDPDSGCRRRAVANRPVATCSIAVSTTNPSLINLYRSASASSSLPTRTATSASLVMRGSARTETARPPTTAKSTLCRCSASAMRARARPRAVTPAAAVGALAQASRRGAPRNGCPTNVRPPPPLPLRSPKGFPDESAAPPSARPSPLDHTPRRDHLELQTAYGDSIYQPVDRRLASLRAHTTHVASSARSRY